MTRSYSLTHHALRGFTLSSLFLIFISAYAFFETGHTIAPLKEEHKKVIADDVGADVAMAAEYQGHVTAGYDALIALRMACSKGSSREQVVEKVTQYLDENRDRYASPAFELSYLALSDTYACSEPQPKATVANEHAAGNFVDGHKLAKLAREYVRSPGEDFDPALAAEYRGYVIGVHDALYLGKIICTVADSKEQVLKLVAEHVVGRPVSLDDPGFSLIVDSLIEAGYVCD